MTSYNSTLEFDKRHKTLTTYRKISENTFLLSTFILYLILHLCDLTG